VAEDALERIDVVYDPLPACASVADALAPGAPRLFPGTESNNVAVIPMRVGDVDRALDTAAVVVRERFTYPRQTAAALETRGLVAVPPDPRGGELHLIGSTKCIHINRTILAPIFGIPVGALRLTEVDVGGGFGVRGELANAVCDALRDRGVGITSLPLTPALVFEAIRSALDRDRGRG
jgi:carbon-monoxide dehydrogenase large subunit